MHESHALNTMQGSEILGTARMRVVTTAALGLTNKQWKAVFLKLSIPHFANSPPAAAARHMPPAHTKHIHNISTYITDVLRRFTP